MCRRTIKYAFFSSLTWYYHPQMLHYIDLHSTSELRWIKRVQFTNRVVIYKLLLKLCLKRSWWVWSCGGICKADFSKKSSGQFVNVSSCDLPDSCRNPLQQPCAYINNQQLCWPSGISAPQPGPIRTAATLFPSLRLCRTSGLRQEIQIILSWRKTNMNFSAFLPFF